MNCRHDKMFLTFSATRHFAAPVTRTQNKKNLPLFVLLGFQNPCKPAWWSSIGCPHHIKDGTIQGKIIYKDRFGNLTTNISAELINEKFPSFDKIKIQTGKQIINGLSEAYNKIKPGESGAIINSWNQLEIFCGQADAAKKLKLKLGQSVILNL